MTVPVNLNGRGVFAPTHKYLNSVAMLLDYCEWDDASTGEVNEYGWHARLFTDFSIESAYKLVADYATDFNTFLAWLDCEQMIDILSDGKNWIILTDRNGFVYASGYSTKEEAKKEFDEIDTEYNEFAQESFNGFCKDLSTAFKANAQATEQVWACCTSKIGPICQHKSGS